MQTLPRRTSASPSPSFDNARASMTTVSCPSTLERWSALARALRVHRARFLFPPLPPEPLDAALAGELSVGAAAFPGFENSDQVSFLSCLNNWPEQDGAEVDKGGQQTMGRKKSLHDEVKREGGEEEGVRWTKALPFLAVFLDMNGVW